MKKIKIVMTFFNRQDQLNRTLSTMNNYDPSEFGVVIVDDGSAKKVTVPKGLNFDVQVAMIKNKTWLQCDPSWNTGLHIAMKDNPEIIIIQNAECMHFGNILAAAKLVTDKTYISFGCYSLPRNAMPYALNDRHISFDGDSGWYNHPVHWPVGYHFCAAITAENMRKLNGFDERFRNGKGFDDDDFIRRVRKLGLQVQITTNPYVFHQWHEPTKYDQTTQVNRELHAQFTIDGNIKAVHELTKDL